MSITTRRYRALRADDGYRIWDTEGRRWSKVMDRDRARRTARLLDEGREVSVRWDVNLSAATAMRQPLPLTEEAERAAQREERAEDALDAQVARLRRACREEIRLGHGWAGEVHDQPAEPVPTAWSKLAEPTYAVSRDGEARRLEAGTYLAPLAPDERDGRLPVTEVQVWTEPEWPYYERPVSFWFVEASALRFDAARVMDTSSYHSAIALMAEYVEVE